MVCHPIAGLKEGTTNLKGQIFPVSEMSWIIASMCGRACRPTRKAGLENNHSIFMSINCAFYLYGIAPSYQFESSNGINLLFKELNGELVVLG